MPDPTLESKILQSSDEFLRALAMVQRLESERRALGADDPRRLPLALDIEELALELLGHSQYQTRLAAQGLPHEMEGHRLSHLVLNDWLEAERYLRAPPTRVWRTAQESAF